MRFVAAALTMACAAGATVERPWMDAAKPIPERVKLLMATMTLEEKAAQLLHTSIGLNASNPGVLARIKGGGMGAMTIEANSPANGSTCGAECRIGRLRELQLAFINGTRLGIPLSFVIETSHCGAAGGTIFPMGITQGASWNASLAHEVGRAIAKEARAWGGDRGLSPEISVCSDPRFGRIEENFGEDPAHATAFAVAAVTGLQGGTAAPSEYLPDDEHVVCEAKHCCAYGAGGRDGQSADMSPKTLHDVYLRPWDAFVAAGGRGMMLAHNELNGIQMHMNSAIMTDHFRTKLGYEGFFASDAGNVAAMVGARVAYNTSDAASIAMQAGMDQTMGGGFDPAVTVPAAKSGELPQECIDRACAAVLAQKFAARLFDGALPDPAKHAELDSGAHRALARRAAAESAVLLVNQRSALPLQLGKLKSIAIIGPNGGCAADAPPPPPPPPGQCGSTKGIDCPGNDYKKVDNVTCDQPEGCVATCCKLCLADPNCQTGVLAVGALPGGRSQCLMKTACDSPVTQAGRVVIQTGRPGGRAAAGGVNPWNCLAQRAMLGGYSNLEQQTDAFLDSHAHVVTVLEAAQRAANASDGKLEVQFSQGIAMIESVDTSGIAHAAATAKAADVAVVVVGDTAEGVGYDGGASTGEGADRTSIALAGVQLDLLDAVVATGTPTVVVLVHGRPASFGEDHGGAVTSKFGATPLYLRASALVAAFRPGVEGGNAIWSLLTGEASFSGRLAQSWPHNAGAAHFGGISPWYEKYCSEECPGLTMDVGLPHGLSLDPTAPAFPFGYGLDYLNVTFVSAEVRVHQDHASGTAATAKELGVDPLTVHVSMKNTASVGGAKVVQVYFTPPVSPSRLTRYRHMLGGFAKVHIGAGASASVGIPIAARNLAHWDPASNGGSHTVDSGEYTIYVCHDTRGLGGDGSHVEGLPEDESGKCLSRTIAL
jgi:beta-glucosidase-like glycosyl hydrolase